MVRTESAKSLVAMSQKSRQTYGSTKTPPVNNPVGGVVDQDEHDHVGDSQGGNRGTAIAIAVLYSTRDWLKGDPGDLIAHGGEAVQS